MPETPNITENKKLLKSTAKKSLKTMRKMQGRHIVREKTRVVKYGASGFIRNIWLSTAATIVMAITLIILFVTVVASAILANTADAMREKIDITIFLKPNTSERALEKLSKIISEDSNTKSVETTTSEDEYNKLSQASRLTAYSVLMNNRLDTELKKHNLKKLDSIRSM